jgi:hypothetical protein
MQGLTMIGKKRGGGDIIISWNAPRAQFAVPSGGMARLEP